MSGVSGGRVRKIQGRRRVAIVCNFHDYLFEVGTKGAEETRNTVGELGECVDDRFLNQSCDVCLMMKELRWQEELQRRQRRRAMVYRNPSDEIGPSSWDDFCPRDDYGGAS